MWEVGAHVDAFLAVDALEDRRAQRIQLGEPAAFLVRKQELDGLEVVGQECSEVPPEFAQALAGPRGHLWSPREARGEPSPAQCIDRVDLVEHEPDGKLLRTDLG